MKRLIWVVTFVIMSSCSDYKINTFKVIDSESLEVLPLVTISTKDSSFYSDDSGVFSLKIKEGLSIEFSYLGYSSIDTVFASVNRDTVVVYLDENIDFDTVEVPEINWYNLSSFLSYFIFSMY